MPKRRVPQFKPQYGLYMALYREKGFFRGSCQSRFNSQPPRNLYLGLQSIQNHGFHRKVEGLWPIGLGSLEVQGPPRVAKIVAGYLKMESIGSIGSIILWLFEVQVHVNLNPSRSTQSLKAPRDDRRSLLSTSLHCADAFLHMESSIWLCP